MILDRTFLVDLLRNNPNAVRKARELDEKDVHIATTTVTVFEVWKGLSSEKKNKACELLDQLTIYALSLEGAKKGGAIAQELDKKGLAIDPEDCMIAGIALEKNEEVLTRNVKHFNRVAELRISSY